jgi:hypothetical protein
VDDPGARFYVEHADGSQEELPLEDLPHATRHQDS